MSKQHLYFLDFVRAIAIVLVVLGHWRPEGCPAWYQDVYDVIYTFHMPVFLAISGYLYMVTRRTMTYPQFLWHKFRRLMVPYFVASTAIIAFIVKACCKGSLAVTQADEGQGMDVAQHGESAYPAFDGLD